MSSYQPEDDMQEMDDIVGRPSSPPATTEYSNNALALPSVPNDAAHLGQSMFMPFAIQSGTQVKLNLNKSLSLTTYAFPSKAILGTQASGFCGYGVISACSGPSWAQRVYKVSFSILLSVDG